MVGLKRGASFAALMLLSSAAAEAGVTTYAFTSVTGIQYGANTVLTGVAAGDTVPSTVTLPSQLLMTDRCAGFIFAMLSSPGIYTLTFAVDTEVNPPMPANSYLTFCRLDRNP